MRVRLKDLRGNDVSQAMDYYRQCVAAGTWSREEAHMLLHMQDNPDALIAANNAEKKSSVGGT